MPKPMPLDGLRVTTPGGIKVIQSRSFANVWMFVERMMAEGKEVWVTDAFGNKMRIGKGGALSFFTVGGGFTSHMQQLIKRVEEHWNPS